MMYPGILWSCVVLSLTVHTYSLTPTISIGAIFETPDYDHFNGLFNAAFQENKFLARNNITVQPRALSFETEAGLDSSLTSICSFVEGHDLRVLLVVGTKNTVQMVNKVAQPLGIPIMAYSTDTVVEHSDNPLLLMLKPSMVDQGKAFVRFFQANLWSNITLFVQDIYVADGFYDQIKCNSNVNNCHILPERINLLELRKLANSLLGSDPKIVVIHTSYSLVKRIFKVVAEANLTAINHAWFITETSFTRDHNSLFPFPTGTLSIVPNYAVYIEDVVLDGTNFIIKSVINNFDNYNFDRTSILRSCQNDSLSSPIFKAIGDTVFRHLQSTHMAGVSGDICFDNKGKLKVSNFVVQNVVREEGQKFWRKIGHINGDDVSPFGIIWPGEPITSEFAYGRKNYRIVTNPVKPFVMGELPPVDYDKCPTATTCIYINTTDKHNVIQAIQDYKNGVYNKSNPYTIHCCWGLSVDLLNRLAKEVDFDFELYIVSDKTYGKEMGNGNWNGMVRELISGTAHMAVAAFSITNARLKVIDFTSAYFFSGFSVLYTETQRTSTMMAFLAPFSLPVWFVILFSATVTAIAMGIFEWNSPFGLNPWSTRRKKHYTLASGVIMVYSVLFGHTVKTKSPKGWPSKVLQNMWAFAVIFVIAAFTAKYAAFIAGNHSGTVYRSINDPRLLDIDVGVLPGSAVEGIVEKLNNKLYQEFQSQDTTDNAIKRLVNRELDAYLGDHPILDYARANLDPDCKLRLVTQTFGDDSYGIALPKGSPLKAPLSKKIQEYLESGYIDDLIRVHFADSRCEERMKQEDSKLQVKDHAGSFVMLCIGIIVSMITFLLEHAVYKWIVPRLRAQPTNSFWKGFRLMFLSQRLHRSVTSAEHVPTDVVRKEMTTIVKNRDFIKLFQKNTLKTNEMANAVKRRRRRLNFIRAVEKARWVKKMQDDNLFGEDSTPPSPTETTPMIKEVALSDPLVDLGSIAKFKKTNHRKDLVLPMNASSSNSNSDWSIPQQEVTELESITATVIDETKVKKMPDDNLFGEDSTPPSPTETTPMIKEVPFPDTYVDIDSIELRKQNHTFKTNNRSTDQLLPLNPSSSDSASSLKYPTANNEGFDWSIPQQEMTELESMTGTVIDETKNVVETKHSVANNKHNKGKKSQDKAPNDVSDCNLILSNCDTHTYSPPVFSSNPLLETIDETATGKEHLYDVPEEMGHKQQRKVLNGDIRTGEHVPRKKEIAFAVGSEPWPGTEQAGASHVGYGARPKESRTFHPRKHQTIQGNRRDKTQSGFNVDKLSKEELLLMWKSSEVKLNERLQATVEDKKRLETKLHAMKMDGTEV